MLKQAMTQKTLETEVKIEIISKGTEESKTC
jgi:hypothetical protein